MKNKKNTLVEIFTIYFIIFSDYEAAIA